MSDNSVNRNKENDRSREAARVSRNTLDKGGRLLSSNRTPDKSPFQKLLEETRQSDDLMRNNNFASTEQTPTETKDAVHSSASQQESSSKNRDNSQKRVKDGHHEKDREKSSDDIGSKSDASSASMLRAKQAEKRVIARGSVSDQRHQGDGGNQSGGGGTNTGQGGQRDTGLPVGANARKTNTVDALNSNQSKFDSELQNLQVKSRPATDSTLPSSALPSALMSSSTKAGEVQKTAKPAQVMDKAFMDQMVQYCRMVTKTDGDKEISMQLHHDVFQGLQLRVSNKEGQISATFVASSKETMDLFNSQKADIRQALAEKGIDVRSINVVMA